MTQLGLRANTHEEATAPMEAVKAMRAACRNQDEPAMFNEWIVKLRNELWENGCPLLWQGIQLGMLTPSIQYLYCGVSVAMSGIKKESYLKTM